MIEYLELTEEWKSLGLLKIPSFIDTNENSNDICHPYLQYVEDQTGIKLYGGGCEFTECNCEVLKEAVLKCGDMKCMLEIGMAKTENSMNSTTSIMSVKPEDCDYIGVDLRDLSEYFFGSRVHLIRGNSAAVDDKVVLKMLSLGYNKFDFIFIDGDHSIAMVLSDWKYTKYLKVGGAVVLHDVNWHPGPRELLLCLDPEMYSQERLCPDDWGIAVVKRLK